MSNESASESPLKKSRGCVKHCAKASAVHAYSWTAFQGWSQLLDAGRSGPIRQPPDSRIHRTDAGGVETVGTNDTVHPEDLPHVIQVFTHSIGSGSPYEIVQRLRRSDGVYRWFPNSGFPLRDTNGHILRWCVLLTDIDERKHAEDAFRESERNLNLIINTIPALAWSARPDGSADFFNQHFWTSSAFPRNRRAVGAGRLPSIPTICTSWPHVAAHHGFRSAGRDRSASAAGRRRLSVVSFPREPFARREGQIAKWYGINTDIEDRKRAEVELRRALRQFRRCPATEQDGQLYHGPRGRRAHWSEEALRIFEFDPATKVTLQAIREVIHPEDMPVFEAAFKRASEGLDVSLAYRIITSSGSVKHVRAIAHVTENMKGSPCSSAPFKM